MVTVRSAVSGPRAAAFELDDWPDDRRTAVYEVDVDIDLSGQAWLPALLPIMMAAEADVRFGDPMDAVGLANAERAQDLLMSWYPNLHRVRVDAQPTAASSAPRSGVGCFFSGGVDSFYSVLERDSEITHLIFVQGFDIPLGNQELGDEALAAVRSAAGELRKSLITVRTDIRRLSDRWAHWGELYHGAALASVGLLLAEHLGRVIIPSSYHVDALFPWGSHPDLDPLWSTSRVTFEHHGVEQRRIDKVAAIASHPVALRHLRVCWENRGGRYNCGECEKCIRTMISLRACGALEGCATLPSHVDPARLKGLRRPTKGVGIYARENLALLEARGIADPDLARALRGIVRRERFWRVARRARARVQRMVR